MAKPSRSAAVRELIQRSRDTESKPEDIILQPPDEEEFDDVNDEVTVEVEDVVDTVTAPLASVEDTVDTADDEEEVTLMDTILRRIEVLCPGAVRRAVADAMYTDLEEVLQFLREWYATVPVFTTYEEAEDAAFQALINGYEELDQERFIAHAIASWFAHSLAF